uniref:Uncharacterized protein n=1 Tax=Anguilla anguilla TaxID=7936 RepID=A0A0E9VGS8_ANGAN
MRVSYFVLCATLVYLCVGTGHIIRFCY